MHQEKSRKNRFIFEKFVAGQARDMPEFRNCGQPGNILEARDNVPHVHQIDDGRIQVFERIIPAPAISVVQK